MACSVEVRVPMLDNPLTDYVLGLPSSMKVRNRQKKWILRRALRGVVPDDVLDGRKTGFGVPYAYWLRRPLAGYLRSVLLDPHLAAAGLFDGDLLARIIDEHVAGHKNHGFILYKLLNFGLWFHRYMTASAPLAAPV